MANAHGVSVQVITLGAQIVSIVVPDRRGKLLDVVLGCYDIAGSF